jgi:hypothetical protein
MTQVLTADSNALHTVFSTETHLELRCRSGQANQNDGERTWNLSITSPSFLNAITTLSTSPAASSVRLALPRSVLESMAPLIEFSSLEARLGNAAGDNKAAMTDEITASRRLRMAGEISCSEVYCEKIPWKPLTLLAILTNSSLTSPTRCEATVRAQ